MTAPEQQRDSQPLVSIIIDNFNYARFVGAAIDSALAQRYAPIEVVVVDDGSTDNSRDVISSYGDRLSAIFKPNGGHASAFNAGFAASRGEIVIFLDADDVLLPEAVAETVQIWKPGVSKVQWVLASVDANLSPLGTTVPYAPAAMPSGDLRQNVIERARYITPPTSGNAFARALLEQLMPLSEAFWHQSAEMPLCLLAPFFGDVLSIPKVLGLYRVHGQNHGAMTGDLDYRKLRVKLVFDWQRTFALKEFLNDRGIDTAGQWLRSDCGHWKYRMTSFCLDPEHHVILDDGRVFLVRRGLKAAWRDSHHSWKSKLFHTLWFPAMAAAPRAMARRLAQRTFLPKTGAQPRSAPPVKLQGRPLIPPRSVR
jgi:glycosyltransferase involved in cell wall biosynthesis